MKFNLTPASKKKVLTPNPDQARMLAVECEVAANIWFRKATDLDGFKDKLNSDLALSKAAKYENMAHDGRA